MATIEIKFSKDELKAALSELCVLSVCHCPKCHDQPPIFKPTKDESTGEEKIYGECPKCGWKALHGGSTTYEAANEWNKSVNFYAQDLYWRLTKTGPYAEAKDQDI